MLYLAVAGWRDPALFVSAQEVKNVFVGLRTLVQRKQGSKNAHFLLQGNRSIAFFPSQIHKIGVSLSHAM